MQTGEMNASAKGLRVPMNESVINFLASTGAELKELWSTALTEKEFWDGLDALGFTLIADDSDKYGDRKYKGVGARGNELRITVVKNKQGVLQMDIRLWW